MKYNLFVCLLFFVPIFNVYAMLEFQANLYELEGKIIAESKEIIYLSINYDSNSETRIRLSGNIPAELFQQNGSNAKMLIQVNKPFISFLGKAKFIKLTSYMEPFNDVRVYSQLNKVN
jgi:hypothetical protein